jgi:hypothetical protein
LPSLFAKRSDARRDETSEIALKISTGPACMTKGAAPLFGTVGLYGSTTANRRRSGAATIGVLFGNQLF